MTYEPVSLESLLAHEGWALRVARRLVREEGEAEDLVQKTWMAAIRRPPGDERGARAWIRQVILNLARERHRRRLTRERHERASVRTDIEEADASDSLSREEVRQLLSQRLLHLSEPYRTVVLLRYYEDLSSVDIAARLGVPSGTVRWRLKVGLDHLRADLDRESKGDRSRWVSALLAFARPGEVPPPRDEPMRNAASASALGAPGFSLALGALGVFGVVALGFTLSGRQEVQAAARERTTPLTAERASEAHASGEQDGLRSSLLPAETSPETASPGQEATLLIRVQDEKGAPVAGAAIQVARRTGMETRAQTDESGRVRLIVSEEDIGALGLGSTRGRLSLRALASDHAASALVHVSPPFAGREVVLALAGPEHRLKGRVIDADGRPIAGATVAWFPGNETLEHEPAGDFTSPSFLAALSDAEGRFVIRHLSSEAGTLGCIAQGFEFLADPRPEGPTLAEVEVILFRGATVSGRVLRPDGTPAAFARVSCEPIQKAAEWATGLPLYVPEWRGFAETTTADRDGWYRLEGIGSLGDPRTLWAQDAVEPWVARKALDLRTGDHVTWDPELREQEGFRLRIEDPEGKPLAGWFVLLRRPLFRAAWWQRRLATDEEGRVTILDCPPGEAFLDVFTPSDVGASRAWRRLQTSAEEQTIVIEPELSGRIRGQVLDASGAPELRGRLCVYSIHTSLQTYIARDEQGRFEMSLAPGGYSLCLELTQTATGLKRFHLRPGTESDFGVLRTLPMGTLRLDASAMRWTDPNRLGGDACHYSLFTHDDTDGKRSVLKVGQGLLNGELELAVFPGRYRLLVFDSFRMPPRPFELTVRANEETRLKLEPAFASR